MKLRSIAALAAGAVLVVGAAVAFNADTTSAAAPPPVVAPQVTYAGPITITKGGTYTGAWQSTSVSTPAVLVATSEPVVIVDCAVKGPGTLIQVKVGQALADVTIRGCYGEGNGTTGTNRFAVFDSGWRRAVVERNDLVRTSGVWLHNAMPAEARIEANRVRDITTGGSAYVQAIQFDKVIGPIEVAWNEVVNTPGQSRSEDVVSLYKSGGATASAPARVHDNFIWGAFPLPLSGGYSGGGIMVGDQGSTSGNVIVENNQVLGTTNYGISVVCGSNQLVRNNTILSSGKTADGTALPATNVGLSMGSEARWGAGCTTYSGNDATGNDLGWQKPSGARNDQWTPDCRNCTANTSRSGAVTYATEQAEWPKWLTKTAGRQIGRPSPPPAPSTTSTTTTTPSTTTSTAPATTTTVPPTTTTTTAPTTTTTVPCVDVPSLAVKVCPL